MAERVHEALVKNYLGDTLIGHISRDGTAIEAREKPVIKVASGPKNIQKRRRGRPAKGSPPAEKKSRIGRQLKQPLAQLLSELPAACDRGSKCNAQGYQVSWNGYKLHLSIRPIAACRSVRC